jgi:DNA invertase Pin-like site-specific DNA recombinase
MKYGYARVSTTGQDLSAQVEALEAVGCERVFSDKESGTTDKRPALNRLRKALQPGDTVVVTKADRLFRSLRAMLDQFQAWDAEEITFECLDQPTMSTTDRTASGKLVRSVMAAVAEFERDLILERTREGRERAKARGTRFGGPRKLSNKQIEHAAKLLDEGFTLREVAEVLKVDRQTVFRRVKTWRDENAA